MLATQKAPLRASGWSAADAVAGEEGFDCAEDDALAGGLVERPFEPEERFFYQRKMDQALA